MGGFRIIYCGSAFIGGRCICGEYLQLLRDATKTVCPQCKRIWRANDKNAYVAEEVVSEANNET